MANKTNLSSWGNLRNYLATNVDPAKDWDNEEIKDYSALLGAQAAGKVSGDKFTEGRNLFQHYLADAQAADTYQKAQAQAENEARRETAYGNYLSTRLGSYLREIQGNAGIAGYGGLTQGQAIAVKNDQENAFRAIQDNKRTALQGALDTYQAALASHSQTAIDQATAIDAAREKKAVEDMDAMKISIDKYLEDVKDENNGKVPLKVITGVQEYIASSDLPDEHKDELIKSIQLENGIASPSSVVDSTKITKDNHDDVAAYLEANKETLGDSYDELSAQAEEKMKKDSHHKKGEGYTISSIDNTRATVSINGKSITVNLIRHASADDAKTLNASSTGNRDSNPDVGTIEEKGGSLYIYANKGMGDHGWYEIGDMYGSTTAAELLSEWNSYGGKQETTTAATTPSEALQNYFAAAEKNGADVKKAYKAGGSSRDILRNVKISAYGNKTFGEIMDAIDNSKEMTNTEKGSRRTSAYNQLAEEVKKQNIKY